jgi:rhodanese-related sulfurtransferase
MQTQVRVNPQWEIHPVEFKEKLARGEKLLILDVRRKSEYDTARLANSILIPLDQLANRMDELADYYDLPIVVHCHHGVRSMNATALLRQKGFSDVRSLAGGIDAWSQMIDPAIPRY